MSAMLLFALEWLGQVIHRASTKSEKRLIGYLMGVAATALVVLFAAVATAAALSVSPHTFAVMVTLSASLSFVMPLAAASLLVYGPGKYRFINFARAEFPLTVVAVIILVIMVPIVWPL